MGRPRRFNKVQDLEAAWDEYRSRCDNMLAMTHAFSAENSSFISKKLQRSTIYTIQGFCMFAGLSRQAFHKYYCSDERYVDAATRIREQCEVDAREKFELGLIPTQLAGLWMSNNGYSTKADTNLAASVPTVR